VAANVSTSSPRDSIAAAGAEAVDGDFMDVAHCHEAAEDILGPDGLQLAQVAPPDTRLLHQLESRLARPVQLTANQSRPLRRLFPHLIIIGVGEGFEFDYYPKFRPIFRRRMHVNKVDVQ
jgi:hypothetical protein